MSPLYLAHKRIHFELPHKSGSSDPTYYETVFVQQELVFRYHLAVYTYWRSSGAFTLNAVYFPLLHTRQHYDFTAIHYHPRPLAAQ